MAETSPIPVLVDRKAVQRILGNVSLSHVIRLEKSGWLASARVNIGKRMVRYDTRKIYRLIEQNGNHTN